MPGTVRCLLFPVAWLVVCAGLSACSPLPSEAPVAEDSTLVAVLMELHLAQARQEVQEDLSPAVRDSILDRYGLTTSTFDARMAPYIDNPEAFAELYRRLLDRLSEERADQRAGLIEEP